MSCLRNKKALPEEAVRVEVKVDVAKIVKYCALAGIVIVGIIFGTRAWVKSLELENKDI
ncbi:hypothetical protein [Acetivibrio ethanolgignens]|uniref:hypothetical protein n=1 Tax=Acetivibrio ethanolgignens TaxID=290052 RepID=UPI0012DEDDFE|nr:hypothetical protein [Acetivibrio ethanolgignens]